MKSFGIVFVAFGKLLALAAARSARRTSASPLRIVVVDNPVEPGAASLALEGADIDAVVQPGTRLSYAGALNLGVATLGPEVEIIALANDDLVFTQDRWDVPLLHALSDPSVGMVGPKMCRPDGTIAAGPATGTFRDHRMRDFGRADVPALNFTCEVPWLQGSFMVLRKELFDQLGGMDADFTHSFEDDDLCIRVWQAERRCLWVGSSRLVHLVGASGGDSEWVRKSFASGRQRYLDKHTTWIVRHERYFPGVA